MKTITINFPDDVYNDIEIMSKNQRTDVADYLLNHIFLELYGGFIKCPHCDKPVQEKEMILEPMPDGKTTIICHFCDHEFIYEPLPD